MRNESTKAVIAGALALGVVCWAPAARANDPAAAEALFEQAKRLMAAGNYAGACPKLEESQRLDPGVGTQFNLADCYEHAGRTATAWALFVEVASSLGRTGDKEREKVAHDRAAAITGRLSRLTIVAPANVSGLEVRRDGEVVGSAAWGTAMPVDPGNHLLEATAPGKKKWSTTVAVGANGATATTTIPELAPGDTSDSSAPGAGAPSTTQRTIAIVLGSAGVVGVGIGAGFGISAFAQHSSYVKECPMDHCTTAQGVADHDSAARAANISTAAFAVGLAAGVAGLVVGLTAPKADAPTTARAGERRGAPAGGVAIRVLPAVGPSSAGAVMLGSW